MLKVVTEAAIETEQDVRRLERMPDGWQEDTSQCAALPADLCEN